MNTLLKQREEFEKEIKKYLKTIRFECSRGSNILDMNKKYGVSERRCDDLISAYYWLKQDEKGVDSVYASYINNSGSIDYQSSINSWNNSAAGTRKNFNFSLNLFIDELLKIKYRDLLDNLKLEEITSDRLQEMFKLGIDISQLKNNHLILIYNKYITYKEKETIFNTITNELKTLQNQIRELDDSFLYAEKNFNESLENLNSVYSSLIWSINYFIDKSGKKKKLEKLKLDLNEKLFIGIEESEAVELNDFAFDIELKNDIELHEKIKVDIIQQFGLNNMNLVHQSIIGVYGNDQIIDMKLEQLLNYLEKLVTIVKNRYKQYKRKDISFYFKAFKEFPEKYDLKEQQLEYIIKKSNPFAIIKNYKYIKKRWEFLDEFKEKKFNYIKEDYDHINIFIDQRTNNVKTKIEDKISMINSKLKTMKKIDNNNQEVYEEVIGNKKL